MNILFVSALLPYPLHSGGQVRIYNLLRELSKQHTITLVSFIRDPAEKQLVSHLSFCKNVVAIYRGHAWQTRYIVATLLGRYPFLLSTYNNSEMNECLQNMVQQESFDLVHIEPGYVWPSLPKLSIPLVVSEHNIEHTIYESYVRRFPFIPLWPYLLSDVLRLWWWERKIWKQATQVTAVSEPDASVIRKVISSKRVHVVPNGVDTSYFKFHARVPNTTRPLFLFVGYFGWVQNRDAIAYLVDTIWPKIVAKIPGARLRVVGRGASGAIQKKLHRIHAELMESVDDIRPQYEQADILLAPIRVGGGTKYKILEAMATGLPVVTTKTGAMGFQLHHDDEMRIADDPDTIVDHIHVLLNNVKTYEEQAKRARTLVESQYDWKHIGQALDAVWRQAYENK